jgi:RNA polymerase sigma-70 factor (ECF subfamily)
MNTTSVSLLAGLRSPADPQAWARFVELYTPLIFRWALRIGMQESDAADLVQDVFVVLARAMPEFEYQSGKSFRAWLRTVTVNQWRDRRRRQASRPAEATGGMPPEPLAEDEVEAFGEADYRAQLVARALELMQRQFRPATWKACWEFVVEGRSAADVARELGISENAVYLAKGRVLRHLRRELDGLLD